jgi:HEAT repeat protein
MEPAGQGYEAFVDQLSAADADTRRGAAAYLGTRGSEEAVGALVAQFRTESEPTVRETIVGALGRIAIAANSAGETPDASIRSTLEAATGDESERVRNCADEWLGRVDDHWRG